jgi:hypothetical protein
MLGEQLSSLTNLLALLSLVATVIAAYYARAQFLLARRQPLNGVVSWRQSIKEFLGVCLAIVGVLGIVIVLYPRVPPEAKLTTPNPSSPPFKTTVEVLQPVRIGSGRLFNITARVAAVAPTGVVPSGVVTFNIDGDDVVADVPVQGGEAVLTSQPLDRGRKVTIRAVYKPWSGQPFLAAWSESKIFDIN